MSDEEDYAALCAMMAGLGADIEQLVVDYCLRSAGPVLTAMRVARALDRMADREEVPAEVSDELVRIMARVLERVREE